MKLLSVAWKEFIHIVRDRRALILTLVFPAFTVSFLGYAITLDIKRVKVGILSEDRIIGDEVIRRIEGSPYFKYTPVLNLEDGEELLKRGEIEILIHIRDKTYSSVMKNLPKPIEILLDGSNNNSAVISQGYILQMFQIKGEDAPRFKFLYNPELDSHKFFVPGIIGIFLFILSVAMTALAVAREKERGTMESLMVSPLMPHEIIVGKVLPYTLIGFCDFLIGILFAHLLFGVNCEGNFVSLLIATLLFISTGVSIGIFISTLTSSTMVAWLISFIITVLPSLILSDFVFPTRSMPKAIELFSWLIPTKYYIKIIRFIMLKGTPITLLINEIYALLIFLALFLTLSIRRLKGKLS